MVRYFSVTGETDSAFAYLYQAYDEKFYEMLWLKGDPEFDNIREDERDRDLYAKVRLQDKQKRIELIPRPRMNGSRQ